MPLPTGKLTGGVTPLAYRLDLTLEPDKPRFPGKVEIDVRIAAPARTIFLHGRDLAMHQASAAVGGRKLAGEWKQADATGVAALTFPEPLPAGPVTLAFEYDAAFNNGPAGLFRVKVGDDWYGWSQFESTDARSAFPSFDEPGFKTPFTVTLRTRPGQLAVSNAPRASSIKEGGLEVHRFQPTVPLPTYLVAMMAGPFAMVEGAVPPSPQRADPLPLRVISTKQNAGRMAYALEGSKAIVTHLEDYFGTAFPYPKLDQITTPIMPGAMENAGADLYADEILIMDENAPVPQKRDFGMVVAHELSHQWFGDLVTPTWWDDIWLNESFANWMGYRIGNAWRPDLNIASGAIGEGFAAMDIDGLVAGRPIRQPIATNAEIDSAFDSITYGKGGHVVAMIAAFMGDTKFRDGVRGYMAKHRHGNATSNDFFAALADAAGDERIVAAMRSFTDQQGVPLLTFNQKGGRYEVRQSRYAPLGVLPRPARWGVPLCLRRGSERHCELMTGESLVLEIAGKGALIPNAGGAGYYRFELSERDWKALIADAEHLPAGEAQAAADSLLASFRAGRAGVSLLAALARNLSRNRDSHASAAASAIITGLAADEVIDEGALEAFRGFVAKTYRPVLAATGFDPKLGVYAGEDSDVSQRRSIAVARLVSTGRDKVLRRQLADAAAKYLAGDTAALDPGWFEPAFGLWLRASGFAGAQSLAGKALVSEDAQFRSAALDAVATVGDAKVAEWLLDAFKDPKLRPSEHRRLLSGIMLTGRTRDIGYRWFKSNLDKLTTGGDGIFFAARLPQLLGGFCSIARSREFAQDLRPRFTGKSGALELERAIERVRNCGMLRDTRLAEVSRDILRLR